jgi:hypothetical protein
MGFVFLVNVVAYTKNAGVKITRTSKHTFNLPSIYIATRRQFKGIFEKFNGKSVKKNNFLRHFQVPTEKELDLRF